MSAEAQIVAFLIGVVVGFFVASCAYIATLRDRTRQWVKDRYGQSHLIESKGVDGITIFQGDYRPRLSLTWDEACCRFPAHRAEFEAERDAMAMLTEVSR